MVMPLSRLVRKHQEPVQQLCFCCWSDLLGFGKPLVSSQWNPSPEIVEKALSRLDAAYRYHCQDMLPMYEFALVLNDGVVRTFSPGPLQENAVATVPLWFRNVVRSHMNIKMHEVLHGLPGPRTIISAGLQIKHVFTEVRFDDFVFDYTRQPTKSGLSKIAEETGNPVVISNPGPLQMNMAFSKAYILDSLGSRVGITGPHLFVDESVLESIAKLVDVSNSRYSLLRKDTDEGYLFAVVPNGYTDRYLIGLLMAPERLSVTDKGWTTSVYRLKALYPHDESPDEFRFDLDKPELSLCYVPPNAALRAAADPDEQHATN